MTDPWETFLIFVMLGVIWTFAAAWWLICWLILKEYRKWRDRKLPRDSRWEIYREGDE